MNRPIRNLAIACLVLFLMLMANITYLQYWKAEEFNSLSEHGTNNRVRDAAFSEPRGQILVADRAVASSKKSDDRFKYQRVYPGGPEYAHLTGYFSRQRFGGVENTQNAVLTGDAPGLFVNRLIDVLGNKAPQGGNVVLSIDPEAQKAAYDGLRALGARIKGSVVAIEPRTGRILAMVSSPTFNPNALADHSIAASDQVYTRLVADPASPLNNRAIEERLPPGSTFKLVTAAAALSTGKYRPDSMVPGGAVLDLPQTDADIRNESRGTCGGNRITLTRALQVSCNVAFGALGLELGGEALREQAEKFGFNADRFFTDLDDPLTRQAVSVFPGDINEPQSAQSAIGQFEVAATPLQMAMVVAGIANNGDVMKPYLVDETQSADLDVIRPVAPEMLTEDAVSAAVARQLTEMMVAVVDNGTGTNAQIPGIKVAGKTGTAQSTPSRPPYAWFVSFAPAETAQVAVAVLIQDAGVERNAISGGGLAAPIAKAVMEAVLQQ